MTDTNKKRRRHVPLNAERRQQFLAGLRESGGSFSHACRRAGSHLPDDAPNPPSYSAWKNLLLTDPDFASAYEEAMQQVRDDIVAELHRRSMEGTLEPIFQKGERAVDFDGSPASIRRFDNRLLLARAKALMPEYQDRKHVNVNVQTDGAKGFWQITKADLDALPLEDRRTLRNLAKKAFDLRRAEAALPAPVDDIEDADFSEVEDDPEDLYQPVPY